MGKRKEEVEKPRFTAKCAYCGLLTTSETLSEMDGNCYKCGKELIINDNELLLSRTKKELENLI